MKLNLIRPEEKQQLEKLRLNLRFARIGQVFPALPVELIEGVAIQAAELSHYRVFGATAGESLRKSILKLQKVMK